MKIRQISNMVRNDAREIIDIEIQIPELTQTHNLLGNFSVQVVEVQVETRQAGELAHGGGYLAGEPFSLEREVCDTAALVARDTHEGGRAAWLGASRRGRGRAGQGRLLWPLEPSCQL